MDHFNTNCTQCLSVLRSQVTRIFGPAFPKVEFRTYTNPLRIEIRSVITRQGELDVVCLGGKLVNGNGSEPIAQVFDAGHFNECCQAITALLGVQVSWHDYEGPESYGAVS